MSGFLQGVGTITCMIGFVGVVWWAFRRKNRQRFEDAAQLPFDDDQPEQPNHNSSERGPTHE